jgi:hypothetical protein
MGHDLRGEDMTSVAGKSRKVNGAVEKKQLKSEISRIRRAPDPWAAANSSIAHALQEIGVARARARAAWYDHNDDVVAEEYDIVTRLGRKIVVIAEFLNETRGGQR